MLYEVTHYLRHELQKAFANDFLGEKDRLYLQFKKLPPIKFSRKHFETFNHPAADIKNPENAGEDEIRNGFLYKCSPVEHIIECLPKNCQIENAALFKRLRQLEALEVAYWNSLYYTADGKMQGGSALLEYFQNQRSLYLRLAK